MSSTDTVHAGSDPLTPQILAAITPTSTVTHEDDWSDEHEDDVWHVILDGRTVATFHEGFDGEMEDAAMQMRGRIEAHIAKLASRAALVQGIRGLADLLEAHPEIPNPHVWAIVWPHSGGNTAFRAACEALIPLGATVGDHRHNSTDVELMLAFGPVKLEITALKIAVCEPVTETREITEHRLPAWAQPAAEASS